MIRVQRCLLPNKPQSEDCCSHPCSYPVPFCWNDCRKFLLNNTVTDWTILPKDVTAVPTVKSFPSSFFKRLEPFFSFLLMCMPCWKRHSLENDEVGYHSRRGRKVETNRSGWFSTKYLCWCSWVGIKISEVLSPIQKLHCFLSVIFLLFPECWKLGNCRCHALHNVLA